MNVKPMDVLLAEMHEAAQRRAQPLASREICCVSRHDLLFLVNAYRALEKAVRAAKE